MKFKMNKNVVTIVDIKNQPTDFAYWKTKSVVERLLALELLRQQFFNYTDDTTQRLQRVCSIIKQKNKKASGRNKDLDDIKNLK